MVRSQFREEQIDATLLADLRVLNPDQPVLRTEDGVLRGIQRPCHKDPNVMVRDVHRGESGLHQCNVAVVEALHKLHG